MVRYTFGCWYLEEDVTSCAISPKRDAALVKSRRPSSYVQRRFVVAVALLAKRMDHQIPVDRTPNWWMPKCLVWSGECLSIRFENKRSLSRHTNWLLGLFRSVETGLRGRRPWFLWLWCRLGFRLGHLWSYSWIVWDWSLQLHTFLWRSVGDWLLIRHRLPLSTCRRCRNFEKGWMQLLCRILSRYRWLFVEGRSCKYLVSVFLQTNEHTSCNLRVQHRDYLPATKWNVAYLVVRRVLWLGKTCSRYLQLTRFVLHETLTVLPRSDS